VHQKPSCIAAVPDAKQAHVIIESPLSTELNPLSSFLSKHSIAQTLAASYLLGQVGNILGRGEDVSRDLVLRGLRA